MTLEPAVKADATARPEVTTFFDEATFTATHIVRDPRGSDCAIVDSVLDFDPKSGRTSTESADQVTRHVKEHGLDVAWILETHAHADHLSAAPYLKSKLGGRTAIGAHITEVQAIFAKLFNVEKGFRVDGSQFDHLFEDGETFRIGGLEARAMHTPGHTPACLTYLVGDAAFVGDTLFMPDYGTARADFPGGDAHTLYRSIHKLLALPPETRVFVCHDYLPEGRDDYAWETTIGAEKENVQLAGVSEDDFVAWREGRDAKLKAPLLLLPSIQTNIRAGKLPPADANGVSYIKIPVELAG